MCEKSMNKLIHTTVFALLLVVAAACTSSQPPLEYVGPNMVKGPSIKAQRADCRMEMNQKDPDCIRGMRVPPKGTVPTHYEPYAYPEDPEAAGRMLKNPLRPTQAMLQKGQTLFNTYCAVCHGTTGDGDGYIVPKFRRPPTLFSDKVTQWPDGRLFHVITRGQNDMPSYASQISAEERWAIVHYVRVLQRAQHPTDADLKRIK
jgi:mono/diheme cytochrome c family protein